MLEMLDYEITRTVERGNQAVVWLHHRIRHRPRWGARCADIRFEKLLVGLVVQIRGRKCMPQPTSRAAPPASGKQCRASRQRAVDA